MRTFHCDRCGGVLAFDARTCPTCGSDIGYICDERELRVIVPSSDPAVFRLEEEPPDGPTMWRCLNAAWGCNWMLPADAVGPWCRSCRLTRGRPDIGRPDAIDAWVRAEAAKRRLVHQLDELGLPIDTSEATSDQAHPMVFDLVYLPGEGGITGHLDGVVSLDLAEVDDVHRDEVRRRMGERFRTVIGHLRHEIGHFYWDRLVAQRGDLGRFRHLFGDERADYADAIDRYYAAAERTWDPTHFVTAYAAAHPLEDWAETFAHYLHILDALETAEAHGLVPGGGVTRPGAPADNELTMIEILDAWRPISTAVNAIAETLGDPAVYPFDHVDEVVDKLDFVHGSLRSFRNSVAGPS
jgi:hypothetical protein